MEALFKRYYWVIKALGIAAATGLAASAITTQIGTKVLLDTSTAEEDAEESDEEGEEGDEEDEEEDGGALKGLRAGNPFQTRAGTRQTSNATAKREVATVIQKRNIFCPTCVPVEAGPEGLSPDMASGNIRPGEIKSSLPLRLMATMEAEDPEFSFATVFDEDAGGAGLYGPGDFIRPGVSVVGVDLGVLHIRNNAQFEYIEMSGEPPPKTRSRSSDKDKDKDKTEDKPPKNDREIPGAKDSINCPNENLCIVERAFVEQLMANPAQLAKQARIVPSQKDGETQGFKFYGIRRDSLPKLLGLKNGDMITEINGEPLNSVDKAMGLYTKLRRASNLTVTLQRKGETISKEIQIQ